MQGHITTKGDRLYVVYDVGQKWSAKEGKLKRRQVWEPVPSNTRREAKRMLNERLAQVQRGEWSESKPVLFGDLAKDWLETAIRPLAKRGTVERYESLLRIHVLPAFGGMPAESVDLQTLQRFSAQKLAEGNAVNHVRAIICTARAVLRVGVQWRRLGQNPADGCIRFPAGPRTEVIPLVQGEITRLLEAASAKYKPLLAMALGTGMRIGEIQAAKWANLDFDGTSYFVRETYSRQGDFGTPKTPASEAPVSLPPPVVTILRAHRAAVAGRRLERGEGYVDQDLIFSTGAGRPYGYTQVNRQGLHRAVERAGLRGIRFHDLRHTCASTMIANGETPLAVMKQLRHSSIKQTMDVYGHLFPEQTAEAMDRLGVALFGGLDF